MLLFREGFVEEAGLDIAVSAVLLEEVAAGRLAPSIRIHPTSRMVAFGRRDVHEAGYPAAVEASRRSGFTPVVRLAGGRAAVFHAGTLGISVVSSEIDTKLGIRDRFQRVADATVVALSTLGIDARVGEVPGEYCPGAYSVNAGGRAKLAGYGQRLVRGAAHVGGVIVVNRGDEVNRVLIPVYAALGLEFMPITTGSVAAESGFTEPNEVATALEAAFGDRWLLEEAELPRALVDHARARVGSFVSPCR